MTGAINGIRVPVEEAVNSRRSKVLKVSFKKQTQSLELSQI